MEKLNENVNTFITKLSEFETEWIQFKKEVIEIVEETFHNIKNSKLSVSIADDVGTYFVLTNEYKSESYITFECEYRKENLEIFMSINDLKNETDKPTNFIDKLKEEMSILDIIVEQKIKERNKSIKRLTKEIEELKGRIYPRIENGNLHI